MVLGLLPQAGGAGVTDEVVETVVVPCPFHRYRVLFSDGVVMDFIASRDDSELRRLALVTHWGDKGPESSKKKDADPRRIVGVVDLGEELVFTPTVEEEE